MDPPRLNVHQLGSYPDGNGSVGRKMRNVSEHNALHTIAIDKLSKQISRNFFYGGNLPKTDQPLHLTTTDRHYFKDGLFGELRVEGRIQVAQGLGRETFVIYREESDPPDDSTSNRWEKPILRSIGSRAWRQYGRGLTSRKQKDSVETNGPARDGLRHYLEEKLNA
jgi:hypothetical protein